MTSPLDRLASRRDVLLRLARALLLGATFIWLAMMALYDRSIDSAANPSILLTSRTSFLLLVEQIPLLPEQRIWGGPATLFGMQCLVGTFGTIAVVAFIRARLNRGGFSWLGMTFLVLAIGLAIPTVQAGAGFIRPMAVSQASFARLLDAIDRREPGLIARLKAGERPDLPRDGGAARSFSVTAEGRIRLTDDGRSPVLRDRADAEGLRFALAEQALARGDMVTLRRLLPMALPIMPADMPARNDFARRLVQMRDAAGVPTVTAELRSVTDDRAARWNAYLSVVRFARIPMHLLLWSGLALGLIGLILRWSHRRISRHAATLGDRAPQAEGNAGRRRNIASVTGP
jgi:hypothetical protein